MTLPGKRSLKPNGIFNSMMKRPLKPNGFFLLKRNFLVKPNGIFTAIKKNMLQAEQDSMDYEQDGFNDYPYDVIEQEELEEDKTKKDDDSFWAVRGKKADGDFWAVRGKRDLEKPNDASDDDTNTSESQSKADDQ